MAKIFFSLIITFILTACGGGVPNYIEIATYDYVNDVTSFPSDNPPIEKSTAYVNVIASGNNFRIIQLYEYQNSDIRYELLDNNGRLVFYFETDRPAWIEKINDDILQLSVGVGTSVVWSKFYCTENNNLSEAFHNAVLLACGRIAFIDRVKYNGWTLIVRHIFDVEIFYAAFPMGEVITITTATAPRLLCVGDENIKITTRDNYVIFNIVENSHTQCNAALLYLAFLDSDYWLRVRCLQCCGYLMPIVNCGNWRICDKQIFDFDNDGVLDLWFRAVWGEGDFISPRWSSSITGFATIRDGEVVLLLSGYTTGGSIGGDSVTFGYDQETSEYILMVSSFSGGFGGIYNGARMYSMQNGEITRLYQIGYTYLWASHWGGEESHIFVVDEEEVCYDVYAQIANRFLKYVG